MPAHRTRIKDLLSAESSGDISGPINVKGWVKTVRSSGGVAFVIGESVKGGLYGEYPSLDADKLLEGDLHFNNDFRGLYSTLLEKWMGLDAKPIVNGAFEHMDFI